MGSWGGSLRTGCGVTPNRQREGPAARRRLQGKEAIDGAGSGAGQGGRPRGQGQAAPGRLRFVGGGGRGGVQDAGWGAEVGGTRADGRGSGGRAQEGGARGAHRDLSKAPARSLQLHQGGPMLPGQRRVGVSRGHQQAPGSRGAGGPPNKPSPSTSLGSPVEDRPFWGRATDTPQKAAGPVRA